MVSTRKLKFYFWAVISYFPLSAFAVDILSWQDCVSLALKNNPEIMAAHETLRANESRVGVARSSFFPQVSANLDYNRGANTQNNAATGFAASRSNQITNNYAASLSGSLNLLSGLQNLGQYQQSKANSLVSETAIQIVEARVSYELKSAFESLLFSLANKALTQEIIGRREENLRLVELRFESGRENKGSVLLSQAYLNQAKYDDLQAQNQQRVAQAQLAKSLGLNEFDDKMITGSVPVHDPAPTKPSFQQLALETPDYKQAVAQEDASRAGITVAKAQFLPTFNLTSSIGRFGPEFFPYSNDRWAIGLNLSLPLFNGGRDYFGFKSASASWAAAMHTQHNVSRQALTKLEQAYASYIESIAKLKMDESFRSASSTRAEIARNKYNNGLLSFEDWDIIENDLIARQKTYLQSKRDRVVSEAAWEQAQGKGALL